MKGSRIKSVGNIDIYCMSDEARSLLEKLCEEFKKQLDKDVCEVNGYTALYWACRYSGLIKEAKK